MKKQSTLKRVLLYIRPHIGLVALIVLLSAAAVAMTLYVPIVLGHAIDLITGKDRVDINGVLNKISLIAVLVILTAVIQWVIGVINNRMTYSIVRQIRTDAFLKIQTLPVSYIDSTSHGAMLNRVIADVDVFSDGLLMGFTQLFTGVMTIVGTLIFMLALNVKIALIVIILTPGSILISKFVASKTFKLFRDQAAAREVQSAVIEESITTAKTIKAFCVEDRIIEKFEKTNDDLKKASVGAIFYSSLVNPSTRFLNGVIYALVALAGAVIVLPPVRGISVGILVCFLGYANQYTKPFNEISGVIAEFQNALACAGRIFELIDTPSESDNASVDSFTNGVKGKIEIRDLCFSYVKDKPLIENFNITVEPGQMVAIVGPTGCGKTTIINLLMRFYEPDSGRIYLDGVDIHSISRRELRENYGMVLQDTWIKKGTVAENIALGKPNASIDEIVAAAKQVHAHSFIKRLPKGYDTVVDNEGAVLSQGQRQLISIARVMLAMPAVLILDEATSSIDIRTEGMIQAAFDKLTAGRTSFVVAHRLSTVKNADLIIVMKDGHIVETGNHTELLCRKGFYNSIYESQFLHSEEE
ncbi:MAG: ABC transporter ATP-binding protein [Clostridia bacterium]|nr:ABC transporter ATP-binding protein [Clostridia bacterium]